MRSVAKTTQPLALKLEPPAIGDVPVDGFLLMIRSPLTARAVPKYQWWLVQTD